MEIEGGTPAAANHIATHISTGVDAIRDAYQRIAPDQSAENSSSVSASRSSTASPNFAEPDRLLGLAFVSDAWQVLIGSDRALAEAGIEFDPEAEIDDPSSINRLLELMQPNGIGVLDTVNEPELQTLHAITRPGTLLAPPLAMPGRPSTISSMEDNLNFDISEFFDIDAAAEPSRGVSHIDGTPVADGTSTLDNVLPPDTTKDKFSSEVSFEEYLKLPRLQDRAKTLKSGILMEKRGHLASAPTGQDAYVAPRIHDEPKYRANPDVDVLKDAFRAGGEDGFLPAFSDPIHDAEFAAFAAAGRSVNRQFRGVRQEFESRKQAAEAHPSPSRSSGQQTPEMSPTLEEDDDFTQAGLIYVAHTLQQNPGLSNNPDDNSHSYTKEEIQWARSYLSDDVKIWMKRSCGIVGIKKPTWMGLDKTAEEVPPDPELLFSHTTDSPSPIPQEQLPEATADDLSWWAEHDRIMSLSELDTEWDAFENANPPNETIADDLLKSTVQGNAPSKMIAFSPASGTSFTMAEDSEMSMIPTLSTSKPLVDLNDIVTPKAVVSASGDPLIAPIVTKLSDVVLDNTKVHGMGSGPQVVETNTPLFTCSICKKVYKKKAYLLKHEEEGNCKPNTPNKSRRAVLSGATTLKLSMTDQELINNGLPSMEARNQKGMSYCTACNKDFSTIGRLRSHVLQFCHVLREKGVYENTQDQQLQQIKFSLRSETDLSVMEGTKIGGNGYKTDGITEAAALRQSHDLSPVKSATPAHIRSMARSEKAHGSQPSHSHTPKVGLGIRALENTPDSVQIDAERSDESEDLALPQMGVNYSDNDKNPGLKYPARMRLFSEELARSSPHKSDTLEPFEDLPQTLKRVRPINPGLVSPCVGRLAQPAASAQDVFGNHCSVIFSFTNESDCAIATQTLEELIMGSTDPTLQSLRMWPSFSTGSSASKSTFEFKVTAPETIDLVSKLRELFPLMVPKFYGDRMLFVPGDDATSNSGSPATLTPSAIEALAKDVMKTKKSKKMAKQDAEQPRRSSRGSSGELGSTSQTTVNTNMDDVSQDSKEVKRRRPSSRLAELHAEQEDSVTAEKKRQKTNN